MEINSDGFDIDSSATFASGKNKKTVKKNLPSSIFIFSMTRRKVVFTSMKMGLTPALAMVALLPSSKVLLI